MPHTMRLGFAVKVLGAGGLPSHDTRRWQSGPPT
jgi:UV DNA damage endonuclease